MKTKLFCLFAVLVSLRLFGTPPEIPATPISFATGTNALKWDADAKDYTAQPGEISAPFTFCVTNVSKTEVSIDALRTSCGCTVAQLPATPYKLPPGSNVAIHVAMSLAGKYGRVTKTVSVETSTGGKTLLVHANIPTENKTETK